MMYFGILLVNEMFIRNRVFLGYSFVENTRVRNGTHGNKQSSDRLLPGR